MEKVNGLTVYQMTPVPILQLRILTAMNSLLNMSIPVTARSNAWVCGRLIAVIAGSNLAEGMDVSVLCLLCVAQAPASATG
jgi:hypothetical protein